MASIALRRAGTYKHRGIRKTANAMPFLTPWLVGLLGLMILPIGLILYWSFTNFDLLQAPSWVGLENYAALIHDSLFWTSVVNTLYVTAIGVPAGIAIGFGSALLLNKPLFGTGFYRSAIFMPAIVPPVAEAIVWVWILNPNYGLLNAGISLLHIPHLGWLADPHWSKVALLMMVTWGAIGQIMIVFLAALKEIPGDLYEAAMIDGARAWQRFRHVTFPMLGPVLFYNIVVTTIFYLQFFEQPFVVTARDLGAPVNSTSFYSIYLYQNAFEFLNMGYAAAMAWVLFIITLAITIAFFAVQRRFVFYQGSN